MDFFSNIVAKIGGDQALDLVNDKLTPLLLDSFKPRISEYVNTHVERTRGELFQQLPDGVRNVLNDVVPGGLGSQRGASDVARGFMDEIADQIRQKIDKILDETRQRVRDVVQDVTSSTSDRVTRSVVGIAQNKLKLKTRGVQDSSSSGEASRGFNFGGMKGPGDFIDNFINSSLEEVRPLVRGELKSVYDHIVDLIPQDARKILASFVPGLEDSQGSQKNDQNNANYQYNNAPQGFPQANAPSYQNNQNQQYNAPQGFPQANSPSYQNNQYQQYNAPQGFPQANAPNYQNNQYQQYKQCSAGISHRKCSKLSRPAI
ncbi:hypothetical protein DSO57_1012964 [Entomophthora muscae]|uniref:Uncharacterized protein n=1 Tax=Entomophthora muscae TaxID=34485 RepID=A0ACC2TGP9_9FUNG|nr:hypothetical protein DSO57_1012964 [Entomophthora muscae]